MNIQNKVFSIIVCLIFVGPVLMFGTLNLLKIELPGWMTSEEVQYLEGTSVKYGVKDNLNMDGLTSGRLQSALEDRVEDYVPCRAGAIITSAALQRISIEASNLIAGWSCYPTFYGSDKVYSPEYDSVAYLPLSTSEELDQQWIEFARNVKDAALEYSDKSFVVYLVPGYGDPSYNPASDLVSYANDPSRAFELMSEELSGISNVDVLSTFYDEGEFYYEKFFTTDHHWNINGALEAYGQIAASLELIQNDFGKNVPISDYEYTGATARWGRDLVVESVFDVEYDFSDLTVELPNGYQASCADHSRFWDFPEIGKRFKFYDAYYDNISCPCRIYGGIGDKKCLLVSNSYGAALQRPLATSYKDLYTTRRLHPNAKETETLRQQLERTQADDVVFVANPSRMISPEGYFD